MTFGRDCGSVNARNRHLGIEPALCVRQAWKTSTSFISWSDQRFSSKMHSPGNNSLANQSPSSSILACWMSMGHLQLQG